MNKFCNPRGGLGWSILKAAVYVCEEDGQNNPRSTADALVGITHQGLFNVGCIMIVGRFICYQVTFRGNGKEIEQSVGFC